MVALGKIFGMMKKRGNKNTFEEPSNTEYPINKLKKYIGRIIEVKRINQDIPKVNDTGILTPNITEDFFYLADKKDSNHIFIVDWNRRDYSGKVDGVISIRAGGKEIYRNKELETYSKTLLSG